MHSITPMLLPIISSTTLSRRRGKFRGNPDPDNNGDFPHIMFALITLITVAIFLIIGFFIFEGGKKSYEIARSTNQYQVVHFNPPKHVYVDLKQLNTGIIYKNEYVSKHYNYVNPLNKVVTLVLVEYRRDDGVLWHRFENLYWNLRN